MKSILVLSLAVALAYAIRFDPRSSSLQKSPARLALGSWFDLFQPPYDQCPSVMIGISCLDSKTCYIPGGQNGAGFGVFLFDGQPNGPFVPLNMPSPILMCLAIGIGGTAAKPHGCAGGIGLGDGIQYLVNSTTLKPSLAPGLFVITQDIRASKSGSEVLVVDNGNQNSVLFSSNGGATFTQQKITSTVPSGAIARYGALLSPTVWYVTLGNWPSNVRRRSDMVSVTARLSRDLKTGKLLRESMMQRVRAGSNDSYSAAIVKTTDGGKTWTTQYSDTSLNFYFNGIDCINANVCVAVGEGFDANAGAHIFQTTNGGATWKEVHREVSNSSMVYSLMSVGFQSSTVVWAAGSVQISGIISAALFFVSTNGGATWKVTSGGVQNIGDVTALSFTQDGAGFATAATTLDDSTVLAYTTGPTPPPTPQGMFSQMDCADAACTQLCQNATFPTNACLQVQGGGSAIVQCAPPNLVQEFFTSQDCTGTPQNSTMPLNKCLQSSGGGYFENFCSA